jgi:hypothetical protein
LSEWLSCHRRRHLRTRRSLISSDFAICFELQAGWACAVRTIRARRATACGHGLGQAGGTVSLPEESGEKETMGSDDACSTSKSGGETLTSHGAISLYNASTHAISSSRLQVALIFLSSEAGRHLRPPVQRLTVVENSPISPPCLTPFLDPVSPSFSRAHHAHHFKWRGLDGLSCLLVLARGLPPPLSGAALASLLASSSAFPFTSRGQAQRAPPSAAPPRCPDDGPACRHASPASSGAGPVPAPVRPWREMKSRRGAPKRVNTEGEAVPSASACPSA